MRTVRVFYHDDPDGWWAESPDVPGYTGFGETYEVVREQMNEGLPWFAEEDDLCIAHIVTGDKGRPSRTEAARVSFALTGVRLKPRFLARAEPADQT
jgi:predicted RNase H-like HicB family nuclease